MCLYSSKICVEKKKRKKKVEKEGKRWERGVGVGEKNILLLLLEKKGFLYSSK